MRISRETPQAEARPDKSDQREKGVFAFRSRGIILAAACAFVAAGLAIGGWPRKNPAVVKSEAVRTPEPPTRPTGLRELLALPPEALAKVDVALVNLLCAEGLPGAENLHPDACVSTLNDWAEHVKAETGRHLHKYRANPSDLHGSEKYFRMLMMSVVLYEDLSIRYNPQRISPPGLLQEEDHFFADSRDVLLHGLLGPWRTGTCSSMPVLYLALGRRLGYPLKLVTTKAHLFLRWEDGNERFNLEATGKGMNRYDDAHFREWPFPLTDEEIRAEGYLKSLTPPAELAVFLSIRAQCLSEAGRIADAAASLAEAHRLAPEVRGYEILLAETKRREALGIQKERSLAPRDQTDRILQRADMNRHRVVGPVPEPNPLHQLR